MKQRVLITGAAGTVGSALWQAWEKQDLYTLTLMDINPIDGADSRVVQADIRDYAAMQELCRDHDVLVPSCLYPSRFAWEDHRVKLATSVHP